MNIPSLRVHLAASKKERQYSQAENTFRKTRRLRQRGRNSRRFPFPHRQQRYLATITTIPSRPGSFSKEAIGVTFARMSHPRRIESSPESAHTKTVSAFPMLVRHFPAQAFTAAQHKRETQPAAGAFAGPAHAPFKHACAHIRIDDGSGIRQKHFLRANSAECALFRYSDSRCRADCAKPWRPTQGFPNRFQRVRATD